MVITEISMIHHVGFVLLLLWLLNSYNCCHSIFYFICLVYLYQVHETYSMRLRKRMQYGERKAANQRRVLTDSETVRWLNYAVEKMWPICVEPLVSQRIFLAIIPWFLQKYKPWTVKRAVVQSLYLGRSPPLFTEIRVLRESTDDDHLVLELGLNFLTADDMSAILSAKLRKRLGFGMVAKMHLTGMHVEGKVLIGVKFTRSWPFISRLRVCFAEPPYFQMTIKPVFNHGFDVTELPGIAGWLDKLLAVAFEETLVEPNMLVVDLEKFVSPEPGTWFSVDVKEPLAYANVEIIEGAEMKPSDLNGFADPYVKGHLGQYRFKTQVQRKILTPKWLEEFRVPICSWDTQNVLAIEVRDKDHFVDDILGTCSININDLRDGQRHDMWLPLDKVKLGRLRVAVTVIDLDQKMKENSGKEVKVEGIKPGSLQKQMTEENVPVSRESKEKSKIEDTFDPIDVEGQKETGIWVHRPGSEVPQSWEPRKGKSRHLDTELQSIRSSVEDSSSSSSEDENKDGHRARFGKAFKKGFHRIFRKHHKRDHVKEFSDDSIPSPHANLKAAHVKKIGLNLVVDEEGKRRIIEEAKNVPRDVGMDPRLIGSLESDSSDEESLSSSLGGIAIASTAIPNPNAESEPKEHPANDANANANANANVDVEVDVPVDREVPTVIHEVPKDVVASSDEPAQEMIDVSKESEGNADGGGGVREEGR